MRSIGIRTMVTMFLAMILLAGSNGTGGISAKQSLAAPYQFDLVRWEATHFLSKWVRQLVGLLPGLSPGAGAPTQTLKEFFALTEEARLLRNELEGALADPSKGKELSLKLQDSLDRVETQSHQLRPGIEATIEAEITSVLADLGIDGRFGPVRWPPVDFAFQASPLILVTSPRHEIHRLSDIVLEPSMDLLEQERLEREIEHTMGLSALVVRVGGIATYPAQVTPNIPLHDTLVLVSHEWLHHYLFFRPLGIRWFTGGDIASINETVANIAGREIGDRAFTNLTGQTIQRPAYSRPQIRLSTTPREEAFDFSQEMRETRRHLEDLLADGRVVEAEIYLGKRQDTFATNGIRIRKLNTAYFAFYGTYGDSPASISEIEPQLQAVRSEAGSLAQFLRLVSGITSPEELEDLARSAGWFSKKEN